ncbi:MAG: GGDEF domain-containing protein [Sandaracinaceae bacterium]|nr:GGDEF domain-containing protein [Sandaracinaceae bacterium]MCC6873418.1 GGDEF domain-containing protein [Sandaracinaceae bacterium]
MSERAPLSVELLDDFRMLEGVGLTARRELLAAAEEKRLGPGEILIQQGEPNPAMYLVLSGELGVHLEGVEGEPVAVIGRGETVGELSVLDGSAASANVVARTACHLLAIQEDGFWHITNASHAFAVNLLIKLAARLRANNATVSRNVKKRRQYERAAMFDGLTGIHNRRWLDETLHRMATRHERSGSSLALSLIDIDHFKSFNDRYGHAAGDHVLTVVANVLSTNLRPTDLVARFGGEEFVIIFPDTDLEHALVAAERVREAVSKQDAPLPDGTALPRVTISMGVAQLLPGQSVSDLLKVADLAMYRAKQTGRNRVCSGRTQDLGRSDPP